MEELHAGTISCFIHTYVQGGGIILYYPHQAKFKLLMTLAINTLSRYPQSITGAAAAGLGQASYQGNARAVHAPLIWPLIRRIG